MRRWSIHANQLASLPSLNQLIVFMFTPACPPPLPEVKTMIAQLTQKMKLQPPIRLKYLQHKGSRQAQHQAWSVAAAATAAAAPHSKLNKKNCATHLFGGLLDWSRCSGAAFLSW